MLELSCSCCNHLLCLYQKDGPGPLLRCYWDRIHAPEELKQMIRSNPEATSLDCFACNHCGQVIGGKGIYEKEQRLAFFLNEGSFNIAERVET